MSRQKVALITGCSSPTSLGAAMALTLLKRNWKVYATSIEASSMTDLHKSGCEVLSLNVTKTTDIEAAAKAVGDHLDLLVNNAAVEGLGPLLDTDPDQFLEMYRINVLGPLMLVQALADALVRCGGSVVNIGSVGVCGLPFHGVYASSKAAFQALSDVLRRETAPLGLKVITVELAMVMTAMLRAENPFPLDLPKEQRSLYFSKWYDGISSRYRKDIEERYDAAISSTKAAEQIIDAVEAQVSGKIWVGTMAWIFKWLWPLLSTARQDKINGGLLHVEMLKES
ncbi:NAD(P)-binding protein [Macroventuria anomochaeta]|uniref:NAD(P)-binding protein n=1 Tax=Macroventuria anomochaeta TaxID=301207 RepID=A0ACB6SAI8_9PLEO|nr:NAD(P)-binding protein [Macroventuria anomochaeta]KAF2631069.1 NAD(P)-binding protein [Macroventuria anomochaeta]